MTENADIKAIADKSGATTAQVLVAWGAKRGYTVIPKSVQESRIKSNFQQVELSDEDYKKICEIGKKEPIRFNVPIGYKPKWNINLFDEESEKGADFTVNTGA